MSQSQNPVLPQASPASHDQHDHHRHGRDQHGHDQYGPGRRPRRRAPFVERVAGWSARHRKTAVFGWLALVALVFVGGQALGTKSLPAYDAGQSGQAEQALHRLGVVAPAVEDVLIQARQPGRTFASDPAMRQAARQVTTALAALPHAATDIRSPLGNRALDLRRRAQRPGHVRSTRPRGRPGHGRRARAERGRRGPGQVSRPADRRGR